MMTSQKIREIAPEQDPLRMGMGWKVEDLSKPQIMVESTFGDSHPGRRRATSRPISATAWHRDTMALTTPSRAATRLRT